MGATIFNPVQTVFVAGSASPSNPVAVKNVPLTGNEYGLATRTIPPVGAKDSFFRERISLPTTAWDSTFQYTKLPLLWEEVLTAGGTSAHTPNSSGVTMSVTTASGDKSMRQTHRYIRYRPGKSQLVMQTAVLNAVKSNLRQRLGLFDDQNGLYFELTSSGLSVNIRSFTSGSAVNTQVPQSSWNKDKLDGTGTSGITLDITKSQIFFFDFEWLSVGSVRFGFYFDNKPVYCHVFTNENSILVPYMTTANLPLRLEIENTGITSGASSLLTICQSVLSEGGTDEDQGILLSTGTGITPVIVTTRRPVLSIRPRTTFNSITNRVNTTIVDLTLRTAVNDCYWELVYNGSLTGASFADVDTTLSTIQFDAAATALSGGTVLAIGFGISGAGPVAQVSTRSFARNKMSLGLDYSGSVQDTLTLVATSFSGASNVSAALAWLEIY